MKVKKQSMSSIQMFPSVKSVDSQISEMPYICIEELKDHKVPAQECGKSVESQLSTSRGQRTLY